MTAIIILVWKVGPYLISGVSACIFTAAAKSICTGDWCKPREGEENE